MHMFITIMITMDVFFNVRRQQPVRVKAGRPHLRVGAWLRYYVILSPQYSRGPRIMAAAIYKAGAPP